MRIKILDKITKNLSVDFFIANLLGLIKLFFRGKCYGVVGIIFFYGIANLDNRKIVLAGLILLINFILFKISSFTSDRIFLRTGIKPFIYSLRYAFDKFSVALIENFIVFTIVLMSFNYLLTILNI